MKKFSVLLLSSWVLVGSSTLLALDAQGGGTGGSTAAAAPAAQPLLSQDEFARYLCSKLLEGRQEVIDAAIAKLPGLGFDINYSASGGREADTPLYKAIALGLADAATQEKLVAAGYRFNQAELALLKDKTSFLGVAFPKAVRDLLAAGAGSATAGAGSVAAGTGSAAAGTGSAAAGKKWWRRG